MEDSKEYVLTVGRSLDQTHPKPAIAAMLTGRQPTGIGKNAKRKVRWMYNDTGHSLFANHYGRLR